MSGTLDISLQTKIFDKKKLTHGNWLVLLHARRIPPHVGLIIEGRYSSLTVKGPELNVTLDALLKTIGVKKIETIFIKVVDHPVFSSDYQNELFHEMIKKYKMVKQHEATCLSPLKEFFQEFYALNFLKDELLFDFLERLRQNTYLELAMSFNFELAPAMIQIPKYDATELHERIKSERLSFHTD